MSAIANTPAISPLTMPDWDDFETAINICEYFGLNRNQAVAILSAVITASEQW